MMEFCLTAKNEDIVFEGIKDPDMRQKVHLLTKAYFGGLYELMGTAGAVDVQVSALFVLKPRVEQCCICLENCVGLRSVTARCDCIGKYYHEKCLRKWFQRKKICPTCRHGCVGRGYDFVTFSNPYGTFRKGKRTKSPSQFKYQCCGGTHPKRSSFKLLRSALKHAKEKHGVPILIHSINSWKCDDVRCTFTKESTFTHEDMLHHLLDVHHTTVITEK